MPCSCARFALFAGMVKTIREDLAKVYRMTRNGMELGIAWRQRSTTWARMTAAAVDLVLVPVSAYGCSCTPQASHRRPARRRHTFNAASERRDARFGCWARRGRQCVMCEAAGGEDSDVRRVGL